MSRYRNLDDTPVTRGAGNLLRWKLRLPPEGQVAIKSPDRADVPFVHNDGVAVRQALRPALTWVGHATYLVQLGGRSILTDPILSSRLAIIPRNVAPGLTYETLPPIDVVTVSHNHRDHMDSATLRRLGPEVTYVVPEGVGDWFRSAGLNKVIELGWWQSAEPFGVRITLVPSQHWSQRGAFDENATLWGGFVMSGGGRSVYHSGDTAYFSGFREIGKRLGPIQAAMLPIGAYEPRWFMKAQHMNPSDAVQAFIDLEAERFVAMHWGTFKLTDEALDEPPRLLRACWEEKRLPPERLYIPAIGETLFLD